MNKKLQNAFTLVELAIVIVIIGLLVGGVLQGQALIRQSQIQKVVSAASSFTSAEVTFKSKYNCLSGDCPTATTFFSGVVNGNSNSIIELAGDEYLQSWKQLGLAKLIKGSYSGTGTNMVGGDNAPIVYDNILANIIGTIGFNMNWTNSDGIANFIVFGTVDTTLHPRNWQPFLETSEAFALDSKLDDGLPGRGMIRVHSPSGSYRNSSLCSSGANADTAVYLVNGSGINCHIVWLLKI